MLTEVLIWTLVCLLMFVPPGYIWSYVFFPYREGVDEAPMEALSISMVERLILSVGISMGLLALSFMFLNSLVRVPVEIPSIIGLVVLLTVAGSFMTRCYSKHVFTRWMDRLRRIGSSGP